MKVILNADVKHLGELGDVKNVANGYARNYLFPHSYALPYNEQTAAFFEGRKAEIEERKQQKRAESKSLKEKLEALNVELIMPAGNNGKLFGSVTSQTLMDFFAKNGFEIERKRIEIPGVSIKSCGTTAVKVHLYEADTAEIQVNVKPQIVEEAKAEESSKKERKSRAPKEEAPAEETKAEENN